MPAAIRKAAAGRAWQQVRQPDNSWCSYLPRDTSRVHLTDGAPFSRTGRNGSRALWSDRLARLGAGRPPGPDLCPVSPRAREPGAVMDSDRRRERDERAQRRARLRAWLSRCESGEEAEAAMFWTYGVASGTARSRWLTDLRAEVGYGRLGIPD